MDTSLVLDHPKRHIGLYAVATDARGERSFIYWHGESAARDMFALHLSEKAGSQAAKSLPRTAH